MKRFERVFLTILSTVLIYQLVKIHRRQSGEETYRDKLRIVDRLVSNPRYAARRDFPEQMTSWFEAHKFERVVVDLEKHKRLVEIGFKRRWRNANIESYGALNRGIKIYNDTKHPNERLKNKYQDLMKQHAMNVFASDLIPVNRELHDPREDICKKQSLLEDLPITSIIICFHNEAWTPLIRTIVSILNRSPRRLLLEIILVDDGSDLPHLGDQLEVFAARTGMIKIIRSKRVGLIRARLIGAAEAKGDVLFFMDSHCEVMDGWLEPLLDRLARNRKTIIAPNIDIIDLKNFKSGYSNIETMQIGGFDWQLTFSWLVVPPELRSRLKNAADPIPSPTITGGIFAIDREYFSYLGGYDEGMDIWGGENLEISFRAWMCGGRLEQHPCSHVGHVFREISPYKWHRGDEKKKSVKEIIAVNNERLSEVWMDEFKYVYHRFANLTELPKVDVEERKKLRRRLKCKSFKWYLDQVFPYVFKPWAALRFGSIRSKFYPNLCLESQGNKKKVLVRKCDADPSVEAPGGSPTHRQRWYHTPSKEVRQTALCLDSDGRLGDSSGGVLTHICHGGFGNQLWVYDEAKGGKLLWGTDGAVCLTLVAEGKGVTMAKCSDDSVDQSWTFLMKGGEEEPAKSPREVESRDKEGVEGDVGTGKGNEEMHHSRRRGDEMK